MIREEMTVLEAMRRVRDARGAVIIRNPVRRGQLCMEYIDVFDGEEGRGMNDRKIILDLCGGTGAWSRPYAEHPEEYDVRVITLPDYDVRTYVPPENVHGILAAPPCQSFSIACNRLWRAKDADGRTKEGIEIVRACLKVINECHPEWWALENPAPPSRLHECVPELGKIRLIFHPSDYGESYTKKTAIWGKFNRPFKWRPRKGKPGYICGKLRNPILRSITPPGFAKAFFEANR